MIKTLIVDDHHLFRSSLKLILTEGKGFKIVGEASSGERAIQLSRKLTPDIVLMDIGMPGIGGIEAIRRIQRYQSDIRSICLTACLDNPFPTHALKAGAAGYITKTSEPEDLIVAVKRVYAGHRYISPSIAQQLALNAFEESPDCPFSQLSTREMQIMMMVVNCQKVTDISNDLHLSPKTVNSYRYRIFEKLNVSSDVELALMAVRHGMVRPDINGYATPA